MCGIGGFINWNGKPVHLNQAKLMTEALRHRGPDGNGIESVPGGFIAHTRLSIIDVGGGKQPMRSSDSSCLLTFNGEIYNFKELRANLASHGYSFRTESDTEVLLNAYHFWGIDCLSRLDGMFAFAVYDFRNQSLFLARDRIGIKPLYYQADQNSIVFASELRALLTQSEVKRDFDLEALDLYLHYQYIQSPWTIFKNIKKFLPGHYLLLDKNHPNPEPKSYWSLQFDPDHTKTEAEWLELLDHEIDRAVKSHLVSDVPFGAFLSGGIDSSTVVAHMAKHLDQPVQTFTIGFEEPDFDESKNADKIAKKIGTKHHCEIVRPNAFELLDFVARQYGEPFADSSAIPTYYVSKIASQSVKMVLSGDGGDELFAGYNVYEAILKELEKKRSGNLFDQTLSLYNQMYAYFREDEKAILYQPNLYAYLRQHSKKSIYSILFDAQQKIDPLTSLQFLDIKTYLCNDILTKVDIASMANSLEVRVPLLDHRLIEFAVKIPPEFKLIKKNGGYEKKLLLKEHASRLLSRELMDRPKQGFGVPLGEWFSGRLYLEIKQRILDKDSILNNLFDRTALWRFVSSPYAARAYSKKIWALLVLQSWANQNLSKYDYKTDEIILTLRKQNFLTNLFLFIQLNAIWFLKSLKIFTRSFLVLIKNKIISLKK